ncbi:MAG: HAD family hydrolase [Patescibacteria group bacterium]|jgi:FMN phosphatase YigB (HAD superfamily)
MGNKLEVQKNFPKTPETRELRKITWPESVWFFDIDDTLSDTSDVSAAATVGIERVVAKKFGDEIALVIRNQINNYYNLMLFAGRIKEDSDWDRIGGKSEFENLYKSIQDCQQSVIEKFGAPKKWSREVLLKLAADKIGVKLDPEFIYEAVDAYWIELSKITSVFPDALELLNAIKEKKRPIYLLTSSDARLKMNPDGQFIYDPEYSEALKRERIELLRDKGVVFDSLIIGDPEDKPHKDFFEKGLARATADLGSKIDMEKVIIVGDQFANDLRTPKEMNFGWVVLINRMDNQSEIVDEQQINTDNLGKVAKYLD